MMNDIKKNELNEIEVEKIAGGNFITMREMKLRQEEEARKAREEANQSGAHAHGGGASGGW